MRRFLLLCAVLTLLAATPALAQEATTPESSTTTGETTTPTSTTGQQGTEEQDGDSDDDNRWLAVAVLLFASVVIVALLVYLRDIQREHYKAVGRSIGAGLGVPEPVPTSPFVALDRDEAPAAQIKGPGVVTVKEPTEFKAVREATDVPAAWAVEGAGPEQGAQATVDPVQGAVTSLTAAAVGTYKLTATVDGQPTSVFVAAVQPAGEATGPRLAWVGEGYGTIVIAITVVATVTVLGLLDVLDSSALAGLFGALVGYIFLKTATGNGGTGAGGGQTDAQTGSGP